MQTVCKPTATLCRLSFLELEQRTQQGLRVAREDVSARSASRHRRPVRQQLVYPSTVAASPAGGDDGALLDALRAVQLGRIADSVDLDDVRDWGDELSLGEQQRLSFARVLVNRPALAILDEATSALDLTNEAVMYGELGKIPGITYVSVGHRPSLLAHHENRLRLLGVGETPNFEVEKIVK